MKIALFSTCALATPPHRYGGTELVVAELAKGLTQLGHDVTVFATGDSRAAGRLRYYFETPVWPPDVFSELRHASFAWAEVARSVRRFDLVHLHDAAALAFHTHVAIPAVLTLHHARMDKLVDHYRAFPEVPLVAISERQAALVPELSVTRVIHHGLDPLLYPEGQGDGGYVAFLGRFAPEKGPHLAVDAARLANVPLHIGGTYHEVAHDYYTRELAPRLAVAEQVLCCGELGHAAKVELLRGASALLFPIQWEEPFGLVMIESMLVGTPVIAFHNGSAPEVVEEGVTGFLVDSAAQMAERIKQLPSIDRGRCRERAQARWCTMRMAREYADLYAQMASGRTVQLARSPGQHGGKVSSRPTTTRQLPPDREEAGTLSITKELAHAAANASGRT